MLPLASAFVTALDWSSALTVSSPNIKTALFSILAADWIVVTLTEIAPPRPNSPALKPACALAVLLLSFATITSSAPALILPPPSRALFSLFTTCTTIPAPAALDCSLLAEASAMVSNRTLLSTEMVSRPAAVMLPALFTTALLPLLPTATPSAPTSWLLEVLRCNLYTAA